MPLTPWRFIVAFGTVSLLADFVYEGARSITGPLLASLGATALVVGIVTGIGEAAALMLRLVSGPLADRTRKFWTWTISGYALTVVTVPLLGIAGTLWVACALVIAERVGKAVRSPAKDTLLSHATAATGRGRGFAVHEALDQVGALIGPLVVALVLAITGGDYGPALGILALPGVGVIAMLVWLRARVPDPVLYEIPHRTEPGEETNPDHLAHAPRTHWWQSLPESFWVYSGFSAATMIGFATFGVLSFHLVARNILPAAAVPLVYAAAMGADAVAALVTGWAYDKVGAKVLGSLPVLAALVPVLAFTDSVVAVIAGALVWGAAVGVQESTLRAVVADLVPPPRRATAYGLYAAIIGVATAVGGALTGLLYEVSIPILIGTVVTIQILAVVCLIGTTHIRSHTSRSPS
ncbi:MFS transporter (plasmid) [Rhodococcus erythropolis]|uniref:MFS transporter n=1 Tax=Rhodococcus qingshengii JCM 15477 TaxID=1303681 RepID=A0AB38RPI3_RHOSG|nr:MULTISPECIES: MFS transporter [Rhodococcus]MBY6386604.1 MFS transporter [Rhodococcus erythropolis]MBY6388484.1 MFS transporter [Rhodococcus erythropolis]MBY6388701.1 MFS transporter [Rhodococcus erythropolis]MBY6388983.1 MFS transporter [Rhodococcus erythropolis]MBY6389116.1 MFS transporter [Rhodococcus erythropolis]